VITEFTNKQNFLRHKKSDSCWTRWGKRADDHRYVASGFHVSMENQPMLFMGTSTISTGPCSIVFCMFTRGYPWNIHGLSIDYHVIPLPEAMKIFSIWDHHAWYHMVDTRWMNPRNWGNLKSNVSVFSNVTLWSWLLHAIAKLGVFMGNIYKIWNKSPLVICYSLRLANWKMVHRNSWFTH